MNRFLSSLLPCSTLLLFSCEEKAKTSADETPAKPTIATVNYPLAYFAERLAGSFATIVFDAPADEDPAFWKPTDEQIARMQKADLILLNGASYAKWTATASLPFESTVDSSETFQKSYIVIEEELKHSHGKDEDDHSHSGTAFTTWMDFGQAAMQATNVANAIADDFPDHKDSVMKNLATLLTDLKELHTVSTQVADSLNDAPLIASHPVYQYFARAYKLQIPSLLWEPEMELTAEAMADLKKVQDANPSAKYFLWEGDPTPGHVDKLQAAGLTSVVVSPCGNRPESGDFLSVMRANLEALAALGK